MRILVLGGTGFVGRRIVERLHDRGDDVLVVHRGRRQPEPWVAVRHLRTDRQDLPRHRDVIRDFAPEAVVDAYALTAQDVTTAQSVLPEVPTVVLSSQDVYQAFTGLSTGKCLSPVPLTEESEVRRDRYPYRGSGLEGIPEDYEKLDVEARWIDRGATVLRLPMVYGPHDRQRREDLVLRRIRAGRRRMPVGAGNLLWTRAHVDDVAAGVLSAVDIRAGDGLAINLGETSTVPMIEWFEHIVRAAGAELELVRVPDDVLPAELALTGSPRQHILTSSALAQRLLSWAPADPAVRVAESVKWHLDNPPDTPWTDDDTKADDEALSAAS